MSKIILQPPKRWGGGNPRCTQIPWKKSLPFADNPRGLLIHRVRSVRTICWDGEPDHGSVDYWCENGCNFEGNIFLSEPPEDRILCARCEANAVAHGYEPAEQIVGRHVH